MSVEHPLIGITTDLNDGTERDAFRPGIPLLVLRKHYTDAVAGGGGAPVVIPVLQEEPRLRAIVDRLDGLVFSGGADHDSQLYGEEPHPKLGRLNPRRAAFEVLLARIALEKKDLPVLAVCGGMQLLNVVSGGTLFQDLESQHGGDVSHAQNAPYDYPTHTISVKGRTRLHGILHESKIRVNSFHHQAVKKLAQRFSATATSPDGLVEAYEDPKVPFLLGVQWHPEAMWDQGPHGKLFSALVEAARSQTEERARRASAAAVAKPASLRPPSPKKV